MPLFLNCRTSLPCLGDLEEGRLNLLKGLRVRLHLLACRPCRIIRRELQALPRLVREPPSGEDQRQGEAILAQAMERLQPRPPAS